jgi:hypothetical protein
MQQPGPCGLDLTKFENVVVVQSSCPKKKNKCKKSCCCCKVIIFELTSTGSTGSTGTTSTTTTFCECFDPQPLAHNSLQPNSVLPSSVLNQSPNVGHVWFNTLTGNIYKQFPNGYWYHQGNTNPPTANVFSSSTTEHQQVTELGTNVYFPSSSISHIGFSPAGFTVSKNAEYYLHTSLSFVQNVPGSSLVEVEFLSKGIITQSIAKRKATLNFVHNLNSYYVDSLEFSTVSTLTQGNLAQVKVTVLSSPSGSTLQVSSIDSSFTGYEI